MVKYKNTPDNLHLLLIDVHSYRLELHNVEPSTFSCTNEMIWNNKCFIKKYTAIYSWEEWKKSKYCIPMLRTFRM